MDVDKIRAARLAKPFGRFTLELDDGRLLPVEEPYVLGISPQGQELTYAWLEKGFEHIPAARVLGIRPGIVRNKAAGDHA